MVQLKGDKIGQGMSKVTEFLDENPNILTDIEKVISE